MTTTQRKAKRKLSNISFDSADSHIALVSNQQGGPANGTTLAILKGQKNFSEEFLAKASQVKVTMPIEEFLQRFFGMYSEQAEVLARALGYKTVQMDKAELQAQEDALDMREEQIDPEMPEEPEVQEYEDWIMSQLEAFEIMKSLQDADNQIETLMQLDEDEYLGLMRDQALIEKAFRKITRAEKALAKKESSDQESLMKSTPVASAAEEDTSIASEVKVEVEASEISKSNKETNMQEVQKEEQTVEMVEKAQLESILKANEEMKIELQKAKELLDQFQAEKKEAILKSRKAELDAAVKNDARAEVIFKAIKECSDEDFQAVVKTLAEIQEVVEKSALFEEVGATVQSEEPSIKESAVEKLIKSKYNAK
jgi:hypothetical protein